MTVAALHLVGCASSLPAELRDPLAHLQPVEDFASVQTEPLPEATASSDTCEALRLRARDGDRAAVQGFGMCALGRGEVLRADALLEGTGGAAEMAAGVLSGRIEPSEAELNLALEAAPTAPGLWTRLGEMYEREGRPAEAVDAFLRARQLQ